MENIETNYYSCEENKQLSITGARALFVLMALIDSPKTHQEIKEYLYGIFSPNQNYSSDKIRVDINTLKAIGCEIKKDSKALGNKYRLEKHPFMLNLSQEDVQLINKIYKENLVALSPQNIIIFHKFLLKLADMTCDENLKNEILGISILKGINKNLLDELVSGALENKRLKILYRTGSTNTLVEYDILIDKFVMRNKKLYIYCDNITLNTKSMLKISRIHSMAFKIKETPREIKEELFVLFKLKNYKNHYLSKNEKIVNKTDKIAIVEGCYFNEFIATQRIMSFASDCIVVEPENFKSNILNILKEMSNIYD